MAGEVEVIKAAGENGSRRRNLIGNGLYLDRKRVVACVRVSTDGEEQLQSFQSQKEYYQDKISKNKEWVMVGTYSDEAITGTKTVKRDGFRIRTIISNEKYKGDLLPGKTFTVDPIFKRRLENMGEEEQYYIKEHHERMV